MAFPSATTFWAGMAIAAMGVVLVTTVTVTASVDRLGVRVQTGILVQLDPSVVIGIPITQAPHTFPAFSG